MESLNSIDSITGSIPARLGEGGQPVKRYLADRGGSCYSIAPMYEKPQCASVNTRKIQQVEEEFLFWT